MIELHNIEKLVGNFLLKDINLNIPEGYIIGLIGANGCGKTSLLHILMGLYQPDAGELYMFEKESYCYERHERELHDEIGVVLQERMFQDYMTLRENGNYYGRFYSKYEEKHFLQLLETYGLSADAKYKSLSKGEELKLQYAFALAHRPRLLLLDEPTGNFDPDFREEFLQSLKNFIADGEHTVILATHLTEDLDKMADYLIYMEAGRILLATDIEDIRSRYRMVAGEEYRMKLLPTARMIHMEHGEYGTKALIRHRLIDEYDKSYTVTIPTIEEFMYYVTKREE